MTSSTSNIVSEMVVAGLTLQVVDYYLARGSECDDSSSDVRLHWILTPSQSRPRWVGKSGDTTNLGSLMLFPSNKKTLGFPEQGLQQIRTLVLRLDRYWAKAVTGADDEWKDESQSTLLDFRHEHIQHNMRRLAAEYVEPGFCAEALVESVGTSIAVDLFRHFRAQRELADLNAGFLSEHRISQIRNLVYERSEGCPSIGDIAREMQISPSHLRRVFRSTTGQTLHHFIKEVRLERARHLLKDTDLALKVVSYKLGYRHPSAFSLAFKNAVGLSPQSYRRLA